MRRNNYIIDIVLFRWYDKLKKEIKDKYIIE